MKKKALLLMLFLMFISTNALSQNTIYGTVGNVSSGDVQEGVTVELYTTSCGGDILEATTETDVNGYYSFGGLNSQRYLILVEEIGYRFVPVSAWVDIPQTEPQSYDFTATVIRYTDNGDGTILDSETGLIWLQNANCAGELNYNDALISVSFIRSGACGLTDGSSLGTWRLPTATEWDGIDRLGIQEFANNVMNYSPSFLYWSSTWANETDVWGYNFYDDMILYGNPDYQNYLWPVRSAD
jgi:hypothetical protein